MTGVLFSLSDVFLETPDLTLPPGKPIIRIQ